MSGSFIQIGIIISDLLKPRVFLGQGDGLPCYAKLIQWQNVCLPSRTSGVQIPYFAQKLKFLYHTFPCSSMAELSAVNRSVIGSSPIGGVAICAGKINQNAVANLEKYIYFSFGQVSEWLMEVDCKSTGSAYGGSNPSLPICCINNVQQNLQPLCQKEELSSDLLEIHGILTSTSCLNTQINFKSFIYLLEMYFTRSNPLQSENQFLT